jgi:drug/metabolite transporter (DMT)-like permease
MARREQTVGSLMVLCSTAGFGTLAVLTQYAYRAGLNVNTTLAIRFALAALFAWPVLILRRQWRISWRRIVMLALIGSCYLINAVAYFIAIRDAPVSAVTVIFYTYPIVVLLLSILLLDERLTLLRVLAIGLALAGCVVMLGMHVGGLNGRTLLLASASSAIYALYIVLNARLTHDLPVGVTSTWIMTSMAAGFVLFGAFSGKLDFGFQPRGWLIMLGMVVFATVLPVQFFLAGMFRIGSTMAAVFGTMEPVVTVVLSVLLLGEHVGLARIIGGICVLAAVILIRLPVASPKPELAAATTSTPSSV